MESVRVPNIHLSDTFFFCLSNDFRFGGKDLQHEEFTLKKSFIITLYGMILKSWFVTPTKLSPRIAFIT